VIAVIDRGGFDEEVTEARLVKFGGQETVCA
jgi:hypothetical protein